jgi:hypothetical protein
MEKKQVVLEDMGDVSGWKVAVAVRTSIYAWNSCGAPYFYGLKKPVFLVARKADGEMIALAMDGRTVAPETVRTEFPELDNWL